jgi:RNA recognition motif. (a.k.a. RRM, RBD, or RNP domain)
MQQYQFIHCTKRSTMDQSQLQNETATAAPGVVDNHNEIDDEVEEEDEESLEKLQEEIARMEEEAARLSKETEAIATKEDTNGGGATDGTAAAAANAATTAARDACSVYVGQVDYSATPEELLAHFGACGTVERVTIVCDKFTGKPKGKREISTDFDKLMMLPESWSFGRKWANNFLCVFEPLCAFDRICVFGI